MESMTKFVSSWSDSRESATSRTMGVVGNPRLAAGLLLGYFLLGLIIFILAFWSQRSKLRPFKESIILMFTYRHSSLKGVQIIHDSMFTLLFMDIINSVTAVVYAAHLISLTCGSACYVVNIVWFLSKSFGIVLHLLCALLSVLHLCNPHWGVQLRRISTVVCFLTAVFIPLYYFVSLVGFIGLAVITFGLALAIMAQSYGSTVSPSAAASKRWIVFVAMFTFLVIYLPAFILQCLMISYPDNSDYLLIYANLLYGTNIQLVLDGFLCLLILRLPAEVEEEEQQHSMERPPPYYVEIDSVNIIQHGDASPPFPVWPSSLPAEVEEKEQQHSMERPPPYSLVNDSVTIIQHGDASPPFPVWPSSQSNLKGVVTEK